MYKLRPILKTWYEYLEQGKLMGLKCRDCGKITFPPVPVCASCKGTDLDWVEMSGDAVLKAASYGPMGGWPYGGGEETVAVFVEMKEGMPFMSQMSEFPADPEERAELELSKEDIPLKVDIVKVSEEDNIYFPFFKLAK
jgi:uncharacterized OB-fold protein